MTIDPWSPPTFPNYLDTHQASALPKLFDEASALAFAQARKDVLKHCEWTADDLTKISEELKNEPYMYGALFRRYLEQLKLTKTSTEMKSWLSTTRLPGHPIPPEFLVSLALKRSKDSPATLELVRVRLTFLEYLAMDVDAKMYVAVGDLKEGLWRSLLAAAQLGGLLMLCRTAFFSGVTPPYQNLGGRKKAGPGREALWSEIEKRCVAMLSESHKLTNKALADALCLEFTDKSGNEPFQFKALLSLVSDTRKRLGLHRGKRA